MSGGGAISPGIDSSENAPNTRVGLPAPRHECQNGRLPDRDSRRLTERLTNMHRTAVPFPSGRPKLLSFDVFGTHVDTRYGTYGAYRSILDDAGGREIELRPFWNY